MGVGGVITDREKVDDVDDDGRTMGEITVKGGDVPFFQFHGIMMVLLTLITILWNCARGLDHCRISTTDAQEYANQPVATTSENVVVIPQILYHSIVETAFAPICLVFGYRVMLSILYDKCLGNLYMVFMVFPSVVVLSFLRHRAYIVGNLSLWTTGRLSMTVIAMLFSVGICILHHYIQKKDLRKKSFTASREWVKHQLVILVKAATLLYLSKLIIPRVIKTISAMKGGGFHWELLVMILEGSLLTLFFSVIMPYLQQKFVNQSTRWALATWEFKVASKNSTLHDEATQREENRQSKELHMMRAHACNFIFFDAMRFAIGRGILLKISTMSLIAVLLKDSMFHLWHFAIKQDKNFFRFHLKQTILAEEAETRKQKEHETLWDSVYPFVYAFAQWGDSIPKRCGLTNMLEIDFRQVLLSQNDTFPCPGVEDKMLSFKATDMEGDTPNIDLDFANIRVRVKNAPLSAKVAANPKEVQVTSDVIGSQCFQEAAPDINRVTRVEVDVSDPRGQQPSDADEKKAFDRIFEIYVFETWRRYQLRMFVRVFVSCQMFLVPFFSSFTPTSHFATFPRGDDFNYTCLMGVVFLVVDVIEWASITFKFHWAAQRNADTHKMWWYKIHNMGETNKFQQDGMLRRLLFPWGGWVFSMMVYLVGAIYTSVWDPLNLGAINERLEISAMAFLKWKDLKELCPP